MTTNPPAAMGGAGGSQLGAGGDPTPATGGSDTSGGAMNQGGETAMGGSAGMTVDAMGGAGGDDASGGEGGMVSADPSLEVQLAPTGAGGPAWANFAATATFVESGGNVTLTIEATGCPDGPHAWHIHTNGDCGNMGDAAGGHWSVNGMLVGERQDALTCADDMGMTEVVVPSAEWTLGDGDYSLLGKSIVVHEGDVVTPGPRMACAVLSE